MPRINTVRPIITAPTGYATETSKSQPAFKGLPKFSGGLGIQPEVFDFSVPNKRNSSNPDAKNKLNIWA